MLTQSKETRDAWRASQRTLDIKVTIDGKTYGATDINSLKYDSGAYNGDTFAIGSTYSNTVQIEFSHLIEGLKLGMEVHPSIGIKTSSGYVYEPLGVFIISSEIKMDRNNNLTTVSASDRFCGLEGTYVSKLTYPAKVLDVIAEICAQSGVKANTDDLARLPHQADLPAPITGQSYRKALGWIAQLYVGYALFDRQGLFTIRTISEPNYELDPSQYEQAGLTKNEAAYKINGIQCQVTLTTKTRDGESTEETKNYQAGDATGSQIKLENNIMTPQRLNDIWEQLKDITFYPFSLNWFGNPAVEAGDWLRLEDKQGNSFVVPNSSYTLDFNGGLSATSKADQTTSSDQMVPWQGSVAQVIKELRARRSPDGTVVFPPSVTEPPTNAKFNDVWFKKNGNATELWIFEKQDDGSGKWIRKDLSDDEIKKKVANAQQGLNQVKADIINNKQKADTDIENLNKSIEANKKVADQDIQNLNKSIEANKKVADESLKKLNDSVTNLQGQYDNNIVPDLTKVTNDVADALQKYISAQNNIADLTKQAQAQGKNIADVTNTVKGLNINYANLLGDVNSTKVDVKGLQTTVGTANGDIAQLKLDAQNLQTMLAGKVDNTTYTNFVNLTNQALQAKLTASDLNGYAKTVDLQATANGLQANLNSVTGKLDNLVIGGRNLVRNSGFSKNTDYWNGVERATHDFYYKKKQPLFLIKANTTEERLGSSTYFTLKRNTDYVVSFKGFASGNVSSYDIFILARKYGETNSYSSIKHLVDAKRLSGSSVQYVKDLVFNSGENDEAYFRIDNNGSSDGTDAWLFFTEVKVEEGNKSTAWTPAPEDERQRVDNITSQLSARITATSQQFSSYYTKAETDNRTNSAKNDAINTIRNDGNWQGLSNILTNSGFLQTADGFLQKVQQTTIPMFSGGGVNLVKDTSESEISGKAYDIKDYYFSEPLEPNTKYTISIDAKVDQEALNHQQFIFVDPYTANWSWGAQMSCISASLEYQHYRYTFITPDASQKVTNISVYLAHPDGATNGDRDNLSGTGYFKKLKVERGEIDTPYSHAPSDNASLSAFSELSQSLEGLRSTVSGNYGQLQNTINQTNQATRNEIIDKVAGLQNQITTTANGLNAKIGAIQVGGRNLLIDTDLMSSQYWTAESMKAGYRNRRALGTNNACLHTQGSPWISFNYKPKIIFDTSKEYTFSAYVCSLQKGQSVTLWLNPDDTYKGSFQSATLTNSTDDYDWRRLSITFKPTRTEAYLSIGALNITTGQDVWLSSLKLEEGNIATDYTHAPEDTEQAFTEVNATINGLRSTVSGNYGNLQTQISQSSSATRNEIIDKVAGLQNQITTTANGLNAKIGAIQVGGRNLLIDTDLMSSQYWTAESMKAGYRNRRALGTNNACLHTQGSPWISFNYKPKIIFDTSKEYTFSAYVCSLQKGQSVTLWLNPDDTYKGSFQSATLTNSTDDYDWRRLSITFKPTRTEAYLSIGALNITTGQDVWLSSLKLEEGNIATDYTHAPEDTEQAFTEVNATINGLRSTVSGNYGNLQTQISQSSSAVRTELIDKVNGLQGQITTQANNINLMLGTAGDLSNICRNPTFDNHDGWTDSVHVESNWSEIPTKNCGVLFTRDGYYGKSFTVVPGDRYYTSVFANNQNDVDFVLGLYFKMKDGSDQWLSGSRIGARECRQSLGSITVPDNAVTAQIWASIQKFDNFGFTRFTNVTVKKNDTLAQINMSAGVTLIQNDKIYMDASSTIFSGNAFIPSAAITSLNADKITTGTLNAANVNIINLNANNITAGTLKGSNGEFYLDSGSLHVWQNNHDAWIDQNGIHDYDNQGNNVWISRGSISAYGNSSGAYLFDGGLYLHKSQSLSDAVLDPDYGSITKSDNIVSFGTSGLDIDGKDGFLLRTHGWNDQTLAYLNGNEIIGAGIAGKSDGFMNIAAKKQLFLYAGEPVQNDKLKTIPKLVLDGTYQNGQTALKGTFSQYFFQGPSSGFSGGITLQDEFVNVGSLNGKNYFSISSDGAISITANGKSILSLNGLFPGVNGDFNVSGNFTVTGSKNAIVPTSRGMAAINAYETAEYYFGDIGETQTNSNGVVTVMIDPYFLETVNTLVPYQVFLTSYGDGNVWVSSRSANNFTVKSSNPNIHFAWEIKAKRKGYENDRMKIVKGVFNNEQY